MVASRTMPALSLRDRGLAPVAAATFVVAGALLVWALFFGGADSPTRLAWIGGAAVIAASVLVAAGFAGLVVRPRLGRAAVGCIACLAALVVWQGASIVWSVLPDNSWDYLNRGPRVFRVSRPRPVRRGDRAARNARYCRGARGAARVRDRVRVARERDPVAVSGLRAARAPAVAGRILERARAARRLRRRARPLACGRASLRRRVARLRRRADGAARVLARRDSRRRRRSRRMAGSTRGASRRSRRSWSAAARPSRCSVSRSRCTA